MLLSIRLGSIANLLFILLIVYAAAQAQDKQVAAPRDPVLVTISEKTTRITTPLKESGYPDFLEAVNLQAKGKVTPEKNGAILVLKAVGLKEKYPELTPAQKEEFYIRLGIDPSPSMLQHWYSPTSMSMLCQKKNFPNPTRRNASSSSTRNV